MLIALRETLSKNPDKASLEQTQLGWEKARCPLQGWSTERLLCLMSMLSDTLGKKDCASSQMSRRARHLRLPCYKLDIGLAFVKCALSGMDIPRGRIRLRLVRPLGMSVPDKPLITQAAVDIYNMSPNLTTMRTIKEKKSRLTLRTNILAWLRNVAFFETQAYSNAKLKCLWGTHVTMENW